MHADQELLTKIALGDRRSYELLIGKYERQVYHFALRIVKQPEVAEEIKQDVFIKLWDFIKNDEPINSLSSWLFTVTKHLSLNALKAVASRKQRESNYATETDSEVHGEAAIFFKDYQFLFNELVERLPEKRKEIFRLKSQNGLSNHEIAGHLNISAHTVKNQLTKSYAFLRRALSYHLFLVILLMTTLLKTTGLG